MSDTPRPKRKFWQFHLLTAVVIMIMVGLFGLLNVCGRVHYKYNEHLGPHPVRFEVYGWPVDVSYVISYDGPAVIGTGDEQVTVTNNERWIHIVYPGGEQIYNKFKATHFFNDKVVFEDVAIALGAVLLSGLLCEYLLRRREARKP